MNNLIIKELYRASLFCKMSYYAPAEMAVRLHNTNSNIFADINKIAKCNRYIDDNNVCCYVFGYNNTIFISFNSLILYKTNKKQDKFKDNIYIHRGLLQQYKSIEDMLQSHINAVADATTKKLYICGYYMGGGLATIAAAILGEKYRNMYIVSCFAFASPKIINKYFKEYFRDNVSCNYRVIVNDKIDLITNLNNYNTYDYYKHKYSLYSHFVDNNYHHVSNAFLLEDNNIFEFSKPKLSQTEKLLMNCTTCYSCCNNYMDELVDIDIYINRYSSIIAKYKTNLLQKQKTITTASIALPAAPFTIGTSSEGSSNSSSKTPNTPVTPKTAPQLPEVQTTITQEDLHQLQKRFDKILDILNSKICI